MREMLQRSQWRVVFARVLTAVVGLTAAATVAAQTVTILHNFTGLT